jgi:predicted RNA-binding protein with PUA-like domain
VRNYQARNFMRDQMNGRRPRVLLSLELPEPGIAASRKSRRRPIRTRRSSTRRARTTTRSRRATRRAGCNVDVKFVEKTRLISLAELRAHPSSRTCGSCSGQPAVDHAGGSRRNGRSSFKLTKKKG